MGRGMVERFHQRLVKPRLKPRLISKSDLSIGRIGGFSFPRSRNEGIKLGERARERFSTPEIATTFNPRVGDSGFREFSRRGYTTLFADGLRHSATRDFFPRGQQSTPR